MNVKRSPAYIFLKMSEISAIFNIKSNLIFHYQDESLTKIDPISRDQIKRVK